MKIIDVLESVEAHQPVTPEIKYRESGDKSWTVRIDYGNGRVYVHTNKDKRALEKIVRERYGPKVFS